jgi:hypothetical protein
VASNIFSIIYGTILPIDEVIFFKMVIAPPTDWIGLREHLQETIDFPIKIMGLKPVDFPGKTIPLTRKKHAQVRALNHKQDVTPRRVPGDCAKAAAKKPGRFGRGLPCVYYMVFRFDRLDRFLVYYMVTGGFYVFLTTRFTMQNPWFLVDITYTVYIYTSWGLETNKHNGVSEIEGVFIRLVGCRWVVEPTTITVRSHIVR